MVEITKSFEIDVDIIDKDHRQLVDIINEIVQAIDSGDFDVCKKLVPDFVKFSKQHFKREEVLLNKYEYPNTDKHHEHHLGLNEKMDTMLALSQRLADSPPARDALRKELIYFLMDDVINEDMDFKPFLVNATSSENE